MARPSGNILALFPASRLVFGVASGLALLLAIATLVRARQLTVSRV